MVRFATFALFLAATPALAQPVGYYVAVPTAQPVKTQLITRNTPWSLQGDAYVANRAPERDAVLCQQVARNLGALRSFSVGGKAFDTDALASCNARAK